MGFDADRPVTRYGPLFWTLAAIGWASILAGIAGAIANANRAKPVEIAAWIIGAVVVHDGIVAPAMFAAARRFGRLAPARLRAWLTATVVASIFVVVASIPILTGYGRRPDNDSLLPRSYGPGLAVVLGAVWIASIVVLVVARARLRRSIVKP